MHDKSQIESTINPNPIKFSVIIPVYNTEDYLDQCIESVLLQDYENLELILVNDGSTDRSGEICEKFTQRDKRILYIDKENGGVSSARNAGIVAATGEYVMFLDSDDWLCEGILGIARREIDKTGRRDIYCGEYIVHNVRTGQVIHATYTIDQEKLEQKTPITSMQLLQKASRPHFFFDVCRYIVQRDVIAKNDLRFDVSLTVLEDVDYITVLMLRCSSFWIINAPIFNYRRFRQESLSNSAAFTDCGIIVWSRQCERFLTAYRETKERAALKLARNSADRLLNYIIGMSNNQEDDAAVKSVLKENSRFLRYTTLKGAVKRFLYGLIGYRRMRKVIDLLKRLM